MAGEQVRECVACGCEEYDDPTSIGSGYDADNDSYMCGDCMEDLGIDEADW